ncbi:MAG: cytochrome P450, partial [Pseudomonadota bacterium]
MTHPPLSQDPTEPGFVQDPYPTYELIRAHPFMYWQELDLVVTARANLVQAILRDRRFGREPLGGHPPSDPAL